MDIQRGCAPGFSLVEAMVLTALVAVGVAAVIPALHRAATAPPVLERRTIAQRLARNVLARARAASAYDAGAAAALLAASPAAWSVRVAQPDSGASLIARVRTSAAGGRFAVTVGVGGADVWLSEPLRAQAPPPGALLNPVGY